MSGSAGRLLIFRQSQERYAVDLGHVSEVLDPLQEYPIPRKPRFLRGVANVHGNLVPVVDFARYLGCRASAAGEELLMLHLPEALLALAVEHVEKIVPDSQVIGEELSEDPVMPRRLLFSDGAVKLIDVQLFIDAVEEALAV